MYKQNQGFTLLELMIGLAIFGIIAAIAMPSHKDQLEADRTINFIEEFNRNLKFARSTATTSDALVVVCPLISSSSDGACQTNWTTNSIVAFIDLNANGTFDSATDTVLREMSKPYSKDLVQRSSGSSSIVFDAQGRVSEQSTFVICANKENNNTAALSISASGNSWVLGKNVQNCTISTTV